MLVLSKVEIVERENHDHSGEGAGSNNKKEFEVVANMPILDMICHVSNNVTTFLL